MEPSADRPEHDARGPQDARDPDEAREARDGGPGAGPGPALPGEEQSPWRAVGAWSGVGFEFAAAVGLFFLLGSWLDATWGTRPWMRVAGAFVGIVLGTYLLIKKALADSSAFPDRPRRPRT